MKLKMKILSSLLTMAGMLASIAPTHAADIKTSAPVEVNMTVTANVVNSKRMPNLDRRDIAVKLGKQQLAATSLVPARGNYAGLDLFILIDDSTDARFALQYDDLRAFIQSQPASTTVGIGYMRNATVEIVQDLTTDHVRAANVLRLPFGYPGAFGSPYLSVVDLMQRWPENGNRHEVLMVTDGIDRARRHFAWHRGYQPYSDAENASIVAQKKGVIIHTIYAPGASHMRRNYWDAMNGQMNSAVLSDRTGGQSFFLGLHGPVTIAPYLSTLQKTLDNQYLLSFSVAPGKKAALQNVKLSTVVAGVDLATHDAVWVPAAK